ncbi:MAG: hypothetical protein ACI3VA_08020 [Candidatus Limivicinus sp.]
MKRKIKRLIQKMACFLFLFMYAIGWFMTYAFLAFLIFGDAMGGYESAVLVVSALAGGVSGGLLYMYILKS